LYSPTSDQAAEAIGSAQGGTAVPKKDEKLGMFYRVCANVQCKSQCLGQKTMVVAYNCLI